MAVTTDSGSPPRGRFRAGGQIRQHCYIGHKGIDMTQASFRTRQDALQTVTTLFQQKVGALSVATLRELAAALQRPPPDAEHPAKAEIGRASCRGRVGP